MLLASQNGTFSLFWIVNWIKDSSSENGHKEEMIYKRSIRLMRWEKKRQSYRDLVIDRLQKGTESFEGIPKSRHVGVLLYSTASYVWADFPPEKCKVQIRPFIWPWGQLWIVGKECLYNFCSLRLGGGTGLQHTNCLFWGDFQTALLRLQKSGYMKDFPSWFFCFLWGHRSAP